MTVEHKNITDANIHEPKGVSTATVNTVYVANGSGSGSWTAPVVAGSSLTSTGQNMGRLITSDGSSGSTWTGSVWRDLIGDITPKTSGVGAPTLSNLRGNVRGFAYSVGDDGDALFHIPHDYEPNSDVYLHLHHTHNGTAISGSLVVTCYVTYCKGHNQASQVFTSEITTTITQAIGSIGSYPQYGHFISEIQLTAASPSGSQIASSLIEPDGMFLIHYDVTTIPTITGGSPNEPFLLTLDLHYKAAYYGTKNKAPSFYT